MAEESIHTRSINIYTIMSYDIASFHILYEFHQALLKPFMDSYYSIVEKIQPDGVLFSGLKNMFTCTWR